MPSAVYEEIVQRITLLSQEEKNRLAGFLHCDHERTNEISNPVIAQTNRNGTEASPTRLVPVKSFDEERKWISQHQDQYRGQFVALAGDRLLAHGVDEGKVIDQAGLANFQSPFVTYIESEAEEHYLSGWLTPIP